MILAAGLGTRMGSYTENKPKALIEWEGVTLLEYVILKLKEQGFTEIIINLHHFAEMIIDFVGSKDQFGIHIEYSDESTELLDTGGGIKHASWFFGNESFLVYNVDIRSNIDLRNLYEAHLSSNSIVTLAVKERVTSRSLLMNEKGLLGGWRDNRTGKQTLVNELEKNLKPLAFSGIHMLDPAVFKYFPQKRTFSIISAYLELAKSHPVQLYRHDLDEWMDMGKPESYN